MDGNALVPNHERKRERGEQLVPITKCLARVALPFTHHKLTDALDNNWDPAFLRDVDISQGGGGPLRDSFVNVPYREIDGTD